MNPPATSQRLMPPSGRGTALASLTLYNLRLIATYSWLASLLILALMTVVASPAFMGPPQSAFWGERFVSLTGLLLFPTLALLDAGGIGETLLAKRQAHALIFGLRWLLSAGYMALLVSGFYGMLGLLGASFEPLPLFCGVWIDAVVLGSVGMLAAVLFRSLPGGYIVAFAWYLIDWTTKGKWTGPFYLFSMAKGEWNPDKLWLLGLALLSAAASAWLLPRILGGEAYR